MQTQLKAVGAEDLGAFFPGAHVILPQTDSA